MGGKRENEEEKHLEEMQEEKKDKQKAATELAKEERRGKDNSKTTKKCKLRNVKCVHLLLFIRKSKPALAYLKKSPNYILFIDISRTRNMQVLYGLERAGYSSCKERL